MEKNRPDSREISTLCAPVRPIRVSRRANGAGSLETGRAISPGAGGMS
ncbi:MAG TPA: hypothetical protein VNA19_14470 [Pyrinomonadaceae bacterium]|nr:hypothetical protein [Pyrinomonadaceae bacterium]